MTRQYVGIKEVTAWPESKDGETGYSVKYADGYTSWSPKDVFEEAYHQVSNEGDVAEPSATILGFFKYEHLPPHLARRSKVFSLVARIIAFGPNGAERTVALRKLLECKDAAVRAEL